MAYLGKRAGSVINAKPACGGRYGQYDLLCNPLFEIGPTMAKINPIRRAEIGREKRARTRAELVAAANSLFAKQAVESVTVDDVVREAGVAKGTFYVHFDGLDALTAAVAEELVQSFDEMLQADRLSLADPALRIAFGCSSFIDKALNDPRWASLVARMATADPKGGELLRGRIFEDLPNSLIPNSYPRDNRSEMELPSDKN